MLSERDKLAAIAQEARRRGTTYGKLAAQLTQQEQEKIYKHFEKSKKKKT